MGRVTASDAELVEASRRGERAAFGELVERYQRIVCAVGYSGTSDRALGEDVAQDTFIAAFHQLDQLRDVSRVREWLCGIARNLARRARRVRAREDVIDEAQPDLAGTPFDQASERERDTVVASALERVPDTYREALVLYYCEHRSVPAVASALGISADAVHQRLSRGRQLVATEVAELVEHTLERRSTRQYLAVAVLAALPVVTPAHANASTGGTSMLKIGIAASLVAALAGTGYTVHRARAERTVAHADTPAVAGQVHARHHAVTLSSARAPNAPSLPPAQHAAANAATHAPYDCAAAANHLAELANQITADQPPITMTRDQVDKMQAAFAREGRDVVLVVDGSGSDAAAAVATQVGGMSEQQCLDQHWPQSLIDCLATLDDLWSASTCGDVSPSDAPPTPAAIAAVTDASCAVVGTHMAGLLVPPMPAYDPDDVPSVVIAQMNAQLADLPAQIEAACASGDWSEPMRRCLVAATTSCELGACK